MKTLKLTFALLLALLSVCSLILFFQIGADNYNILDSAADEAKQFQLGFLGMTFCMSSGLVLLIIKNIDN